MATKRAPKAVTEKAKAGKASSTPAKQYASMSRMMHDRTQSKKKSK